MPALQHSCLATQKSSRSTGGRIILCSRLERLPHKLTLVLVQQQMPWDAPLTLPRLDLDPANRHNQVACVLTQQRVFSSSVVPSRPIHALLTLSSWPCTEHADVAVASQCDGEATAKGHTCDPADAMRRTVAEPRGCRAVDRPHALDCTSSGLCLPRNSWPGRNSFRS
jgi:hypothetical protein